MQTREDLDTLQNTKNSISNKFQAKQKYSFKESVTGDLKAWMKLWSKDITDESSLSLKQSLKLTWNYAGLRATLLFRVAHFLWEKKVPAIPGILTRLNITLHGFDVPASVQIGPGLYVPHPVATVIMAEEIGSNVSLISSITIGMRDGLKFPKIGNNVFIGTGAKILGNITIGDNVNIGANAVVLKDVPDGATAVGVPAKIKLPYQEEV